MNSKNNSIPHGLNSQSSIFQVNDLTKNFNKKTVLNKISFNLEGGEILGIIGPSGGGKTTLLRCLGLLEIIDGGHFKYNGRIQTIIKPREVIKISSNEIESEEQISDFTELKYHQDIGFVFQEYNLWSWMSVLDNLILAPTIVKKIDRQSAIKKANTLCKQFGLIDKINSNAWELSGGQRQRVAILRALMMEPKVMLLDEITSALDPNLTVEVMQAILQLQKRGITMIIVTHHIEFATSLCNRIMFLSGGEIIQLDKPKILRNSPVNLEVKRFLEVLKAAR